MHDKEHGDGATERIWERYDREASVYRELWAPVLRPAWLDLARELSGPPAARVLDLGSGVGTLLPELAAAFPGAWVAGMDRSPGMIALAPGQFPRGVMDAGRLAIRSESMDVVVMAFMLFHLADPEEGLREARRVLRRGGRVGTITWGGELESPATRIWAESLDAHGAAPADPATETRHEQVDTPEKVDALFQSAGFSTTRCWMGALVSAIDAEHLIRLRTSLGCNKPRYDSLDAAQRESCVATARRGMAGLTRDDFMARGRVVYGVAVA